MNAFGESQSIKRIEDVRFLTGEGRYVDDQIPEGALIAHFLRAPVAHAAITGIDTEAARAMPGVHAILTLADLEAAGMTPDLPAITVTNSDGTAAAAPPRRALARDKVRFVGEPVALILAETKAQALDAAEAVEVSYDELPAHLDIAPGGMALHPEAPENLAYDWSMGDAARVEAAFAGAAHRVTLTVEDNRVIVNSLEPRGATAEWRDGRLHLAFNGQGVWNHKDFLAKAFSTDPAQVRVTIPDVGGGFGMKNGPYPEQFALAGAAKITGRPCHWMSDRGEAMLTDNSGRDLVSTAELAFDADLRLIGYRVDILSNLGAYNSVFGQLIQSQLFSRVLTGVYDVQAAFIRARGIYTNTTQVDAYRGAGRPEAIYMLERAMDHAARELRVDPFTLRRRNFIAPAAFPYATATGETYDVGDFDRVLSRIESEADIAGFKARRAASEAAGKLRGLGLSYYLEAILGDPSEGATVEFTEAGGVNLYVGTQSNGQGHETVYAQFLSDRTGIPVDRIAVVQGDSDLIARGGGTGGSRSVTTQANATLVTVTKLVAAYADFLDEEMGSRPDFEDGRFRAAGSNLTPTLLEAAAMARTRGRDDLMRHSERMTLPGRSFPNGAHVAEVEIDPETGKLVLDRYTVTDDFGNLVHPQLAEGQVHGGVAQGFGQAVMEQVGFDETGQLLTGSFMDYALPRAKDMPMMRFTTEPVPSTANPLGMKGCGEAGTVGALAAISNAALDALWARGVRKVDMPLTPARIWGWLQHSGEGGEPR
ncbi:xanthine dehydrogenase [Defluviimonas sp. 20V17]|uniref:Carbon monoxide dehydrogenase n=1 Tax=Allgaiera indica TaxID=765699 RepID=A0AAN4UTV0_9RHOB|nr:xanthine dehydrogenase family protein molybdopterin-binding subunit [Allgaiera indica]KDB05618.1 xanthine dehydrogenase [Defluviimonas sp. 20V17]GHE04357.1 carbon monoxide dehydrogenase [Allgaiera indica]SDX40410.1 carbon-monoxide dehydrogenase large subunit [Allgaiera indica]